MQAEVHDLAFLVLLAAALLGGCSVAAWLMSVAMTTVAAFALLPLLAAVVAARRAGRCQTAALGRPA